MTDKELFHVYYFWNILSSILQRHVKDYNWNLFDIRPTASLWIVTSTYLWVKFKVWTCVWWTVVLRCGWCSLGGEIGSLFILMGSGDDVGGGVLLDTARCGKHVLLCVSEVGIWWPVQDIDDSPISDPILKSWAPKDVSALG